MPKIEKFKWDILGDFQTMWDIPGKNPVLNIGKTKLVGSPCKRDAVLLMLLTLYLIFDAEDTKMQECFFSFPTSLYFLLKNIVEFTVFENPIKVSFNFASEASYVYILSGQKFIKNAKNCQFWRLFENLKIVVNQCYQRVIFNLTKIGQKC